MAFLSILLGILFIFTDRFLVVCRESAPLLSDGKAKSLLLKLFVIVTVALV